MCLCMNIYKNHWKDAGLLADHVANFVADVNVHGLI